MEETINIKAVIEYDGTSFNGWQKQQNHRTVQGELEEALRRILGHPVSLFGSSRTDTGVHAICQVSNFLTIKELELGKLLRSINALTGDDIRVLTLEKVSPEFHARFSAHSRTYQYFLGTSDRSETPFCRKYIWFVGTSLNIESMEQSSSSLIGIKDFTNLAKKDPDRDNFISIVYDAGFNQWKLGYVFRIRANRFLPQMVRRIVGILVAIGKDQTAPDTLEKHLEGDIAPTIKTYLAPPRGLFLSGIDYGSPHVTSKIDSEDWDWRYLNEIFH